MAVDDNKSADFGLIAITPEKPVADEAALISMMLNMNVFSRVHLRHPGVSASEIEGILRDIPQVLRSRVSVHYHLKLAVEYCTGIHFGSDNGHIPDRFDGLVSKSCHSLDEVGEAFACGCDYVTLSPIFDSISKHGYASRFDLSDKQLLRTLLSGSVVALGGVDYTKISVLKKAGFSGGAMLGAVGWTDRDIHSWLNRSMRGMLQVITDSPTVVSTVRQTFDVIAAGARWVQVRMKNATVDEVADALRRIIPAAVSNGVTLIVDDHTELATLPGVSGVHLGQTDMPIARARKILGAGKIIGLTVNNLRQALQLAAAEVMPDYIGVGPWKFTSTKQRLAPVLGAEGIADIVRTIRGFAPNMRFVAIGGITPADAAAVIDTGVDGIAVSSAVHRADNIEAVITELKNITNNNRNNYE